MSSFDTLNFDNRNLYKLPVDGTSSVSNEKNDSNTNGDNYETVFSRGMKNLNILSPNLLQSISGPNLKKTSRIIPNAIFTYTELQPVQKPEIICISPSALSLLNIPYKESEEYDTNEIKLMAQFLSGSKLIPGSNPAAHIYCGHQFGNFAGQLGDGAAMYMGEVVKTIPSSQSQHEEERYEFQLKGAGITPCSRTADGRKVLRSSIREFLCSEAMHYLNIPTTRAGSLVTSGSTVVRDPLYNGNNVAEKCTIISRIASNFFRFGSFEIFKGSESSSGGENSENDRVGPSAGNEALKKQLLNHILLYYPELQQKKNQQQQDQSQQLLSAQSPQSSQSSLSEEDELYISFFRELVKRTAELVAKWQSVGFVHGVLNTDNMSIMGLTIDYGPFAFLEHYDGDFTPNGSDTSGRYTFDNQKDMCKWNLHKLAEVLHPLIPLHTGKAIIEETYDSYYEKEYYTIMSRKLGLIDAACNSEMTSAAATTTATHTTAVGRSVVTDESFKVLVTELFESFIDTGADFTDTFQALTDLVIQLHALPTMTDVTTTAATASNGMNSNEIEWTVAEEEIIQSTVEKIASRCASLEEQLAANKRKLSIHKPGMHPQQLMQLLALLEQRPQDVSELFGGVPLDALKNELMSEKRKLDKRNKLIKHITMLQEKLQDNNEAAATSEKKEEDIMSWKEWLFKYMTFLKQHHNQHVSSAQITSASASAAVSDSYHDSLSIAIKTMQNTNPTFILRNWIAQEAIEAAEKYNDFTKVRTVFNMLKQPFNPMYNVFLYTTDTSIMMICNIQTLKLSNSNSANSLSNVSSSTFGRSEKNSRKNSITSEDDRADVAYGSNKVNDTSFDGKTGTIGSSTSKKMKSGVLNYDEGTPRSSTKSLLDAPLVENNNSSSSSAQVKQSQIQKVSARAMLKPEEREFIKTPPPWADSLICTCSS